MNRARPLLFGLAPLASMLALALACQGGPEDTGTSSSYAALEACHLLDGTVEKDASLHACDPNDHKKTTICHIPPGNPANAHTLCVGNAAVAAHLRNHGDSLGACVKETTCEPPPPATNTGGAPSTTPTGGTSGGDYTPTGGTSGGDYTPTGGTAPLPPVG